MSNDRQRHDLYGPIHKAIRVSLCEMIARLGRADFDDDVVAAESLAALRAQLRFSASHLRHEDTFIHPALLARAPHATDVLEHDHASHDAAFELLERAICEVEAAPAGQRGHAARRLYLAFTTFVAEDLEHMAVEERLVGPLLQSLFSDHELMAMEGAIVAAMAPDDAMAALAMMIPAINLPERAAFLSFIRETAPLEVFTAVINVAAKPHLASEDWAELAQRLKLAA